MDKVTWYQANTKNPEIEKPLEKAADEADKVSIIKMRNKEMADETYLANNSEAADFYTTYDKYKVTKEDKEEYDKFLNSLSKEEKDLS